MLLQEEVLNLHEMRCINKVSYPKKTGLGYYNVPCGQCYACRVNKTQEWTFRLMLELTEWKHASFVTLTYDDENLPAGNGLNYRDLQLFIKRLRKVYDEPIKYYAIGEYGDNEQSINYGNSDGSGGFLGRPHFHLIIFGLPPDNNSKQLMCRIWRLCDPQRFLYNNKGVAQVTIDSIAYVAGYCQKKLTGQLGKDVYTKQGLAAPQTRCSQAIGLNAFIKNIDQIKSNGCVFWNGTRIPVPKYFRDKFDLRYYPNKDELSRMAKIAFGKEFKEDDLHYYAHYYSEGLLQELVAKKNEKSNEQHRLDHLASVRAKKSLRQSYSYTNRSFE